MNAQADAVRAEAVRGFLLDFQERWTRTLEAFENGASFRTEVEERAGGGQSRRQLLQGGEHLERAAVCFTQTRDGLLPSAASERKPQLAGRPYQAVSLSTIVHPRNPYAPTMHANLRYFAVDLPAESDWWFGGGFDLTPHYGYVADAVAWHRAAAEALAPFGPQQYGRMKDACDRYFHLPHRGEMRGIGGIFFDDFRGGGFEDAFALLRAVAGAFSAIYPQILRRRRDQPYGPRERAWQRLRRGRYVEFNLLLDRGTRFGFEAGLPAENLLVSLPPQAAWSEDDPPAPGSPEADLVRNFLQPRDWLAEAAQPPRNPRPPGPAGD